MLTNRSITTLDVQKGYLTPELAVPTDERVKAVAHQIERPRHILSGITQYRAELKDDPAHEDIKKQRLRAVAAHHCRPTLTEMMEAREAATAELQKIEEKKQAAFALDDLLTHARLSQIRSELSALMSSDRIRRISRALIDNDSDIIQAIALFPANEQLCPTHYYLQCKDAHVADVLGAELHVAEDLATCIARLDRSIESFSADMEGYLSSPADEGKHAFNAAMSADFESAEAE